MLQYARSYQIDLLLCIGSVVLSERDKTTPSVWLLASVCQFRETLPETQGARITHDILSRRGKHNDS